MAPRLVLADRCAQILAALCVERGWALSVQQREAVVAGLLPYLQADGPAQPKSYTDQQLRYSLIAYHEDHELVQALQNAEQLQHSEAWARWMQTTRAVLRKQGFAWSRDAAEDQDDLVHIALSELVRALPSYRYGSRFALWATQVIVQRMKRYIRDKHAAKRAAEVEPLEEHAAGTGAQPDDATSGKLLVAQVYALLAAYPDQRLPILFRLWFEEDLPTAEIGARLHISEPRVRALLAELRAYLRAHPDILAWRDAEHAT